MTDNSLRPIRRELIMMLFITWAIVTACFLVLTRISIRLCYSEGIVTSGKRAPFVTKDTPVRKNELATDALDQSHPGC